MRARAIKRVMRSLFVAPVTLHGLIRYTAASAPDCVAAMSTEAIENSEHNSINYYMKMRRPVVFIFM